MSILGFFLMMKIIQHELMSSQDVSVYDLLHIFVQPVEHIFSGRLDAEFVFGVHVLSFAVHKPMSLTRKDFYLIIHCAVLL